MTSFKLPRFDGAKGQLFNRDKILDSTIKCCYGPRQLPNKQYDYLPPNDWRKANSLLRIPEVVWLGLYFEDANAWQGNEPTSTIDYYPVTTTQTVAPYQIINGVQYYYVLNSNGGYPDTTSFIINNSSYLEQQRILNIYNSVKTKIEKLRPNKTWIDVINWNEAYDEQGGMPYYPPYAIPIAPPTQIPSFGTDFYHIWCGPVVTNSNEFPTISHPDDGSDFPNTLQITGPISKLDSNFKNITRYKNDLYVPVEDWSAIPTAGDGELLIANPNYDLYPWNYKSYHSDNISQLTKLANMMSKYNTTYKGGSDQITEDLLVKAIADNFNFDPDTGKDVAQ